MKSFLLAAALIMASTINAQGPPAHSNANANANPPAAPQTTAAAAVNPGPAVVNPPPVQQPPVTPQQPPATPQYGAPGAQQPGFNPYMMMGGNCNTMDHKTLDCSCGQCRNRRIVMSPGQGFTLKCDVPFQCDGLDLTLNIAHDPTNWGSQVSDVNNLEFNVPTNGVTINMRSLAFQNIEIDNLNCKVMGACRNLKIIAGFGIETWNMNVKCEQPGACTGCTVNGQSCEMLSMMQGHNNGFMPYGFGYTNTPNQPGAGGAPQQQPQQYPQQPAMPQFQPYPQWI